MRAWSNEPASQDFVLVGSRPVIEPFILKGFQISKLRT